eukprot:8218788-Heterocapsa_arctica.AAC.1
MHKQKIEAYQKDVYELNDSMSPWVTGMTMDQALMIRSWILTIDVDNPASKIRVQDDTSLKAPEMEHSEFEKKMHK